MATVEETSEEETTSIAESTYGVVTLAVPYLVTINEDTILMSNLETSEKISDLPKESIVTVIVDKPERIEKFSEEYRQYLKDDKNFNIFYEFEISLDECAEYAKKLNRQFRRRYWNPIKIKLAY